MLAVAGGKGGCGKTTTTLGLALVAGRLGHSVLTVDADVDVPDLHRVAGVEGPDDRHPDTFGPRDSEGQRDPVPRPVPGSPGVAVLPARPGTKFEVLHDRIQTVAREYDVVLLDCPSGGGRDAAIPLRIADRTVLVTTDEEPSVRDAAKTGAMARAVGTPVVGAVLTHAERVPDDVDALFDALAVEAVPSASSPLQDRAILHRYRRVLRRLPSI